MSGFSLDEIANLTFDQFILYSNTVSKQRQADFKNALFASFQGSRGDPKDVERILKQE